MTLAGILDTDDERAGRRLIDQAGTILTGSRGDVPASFVVLLLARAAPEDLVRYDARELAAFAERAWDFLQDRKSGVPRIRFESPGEAGNAGRLHAVSVIEIVNDDMPFLLDSVMNDLTEQGVDIRLVAHPIFSVERDSFGRLLGFHDTSPLGSAVTRESFIHIHTERIEDAARRAAIIKSLTQVLGEVRVSVKDWRAMTGRIGEVIAKLRANPPPLPPEEVSEAAQFLE